MRLEVVNHLGIFCFGAFKSASLLSCIPSHTTTLANSYHERP